MNIAAPPGLTWTHSQKMMDISLAYQTNPRPVGLARRPLSPWLLLYTDQRFARNPSGHMPGFVLGEPFPEADAPALILPLVTKVREPRLWHDRLAPLVELWSRRALRSLSASLRACEVLGWAL